MGELYEVLSKISNDFDKTQCLSEHLKELSNKLSLLNISGKEFISILNKVALIHINEKENQSNFILKISIACEQYLNIEDKLNVLFMLKEPTDFREYANRYYKELETELKKVVFFDTVDDLYDSFDFQFLLDQKYGKGLYKVYYKNFFFSEIIYEFYCLFHHVTNFNDGGEIIKWNPTLFHWMTFSQLISILKNKTTNDIEIEAIIDFLLVSYCDELTKTDILNNEKMVNIILNGIYIKESILTFENYELNIIYSKIRSILGTTPIEPSQVTTIRNINYLKALNYLKTLSKKERKQDILYLKCFQIFLKELLKKFKEEINKEDLIIIEALFQRTINQDVLIDILRINNKKTLYHYFKTNELILNIPLSLEQIKRYNAKHYLELKPKRCRLYLENTEFDDDMVDAITALDYFDYDFIKRTNLLELKEIPYILKKLVDSTLEVGYIEKLKKVIIEYLLDLEDKKESIELIFDIFDLLYKDNYPKITYHKIKKTIDSCNYILFPNNKLLAKELEKLNFICKGEPLHEKLAGIKLYNDYRLRISSSIPDICGCLANYSYQMVDIHDSSIISNGIGNYVLPDNKVASSCLTPNGKASSCLNHGATNVHGRFFKITYQDKIVAYSWVWRAGEVLCFDNIEITKDLLNDFNYQKLLSDIYHIVAKKLIEITTCNEKNGIKLIILGKNKIDVSNEYLDKLPKVNDYTKKLYKPTCDEKLYLKDSETTQIILEGNFEENLSTKNVEPIYLYKRKKVQKINEINKKILYDKINSIYFDYCLENNFKYTKIIEDTFVDGYLAEDWFYGLKKDGKSIFGHYGKDTRQTKEVEKYIQYSNTKLPTKSVSDLNNYKEKLKYLLDKENYVIDDCSITKYLENDSKMSYLIAENDYLHGTSNLENFSQILLEKEITSAYKGNRTKMGINNRRYYISVAKVGNIDSDTKNRLPAFILDENICAFTTTNNISLSSTIYDSFVDTTYPLRPNVGGNYEWQVLNSISLDKAKGILISNKNIYDIARIIMLQEKLGNDLPIITFEEQQIIDKEVVKKYIKLK